MKAFLSSGNTLKRALFFLLLFFPNTSAMSNPALSAKEVDCLSNMVYYEARSEGPIGMAAVAFVAINRTRHPEVYGSSLCEVIHKPYQFEGMKYYSPNKKDKKSWETAKAISKLSLAKRIPDPAKGALYFHTKAITPKWSFNKIKTTILGNHIFYR